VTFLDAYALVALIADEPASEEVQALLREGNARVVVVNLSEAIDVATRVHHASNTLLRDALEPLLLSRVLQAAVSGEQDAWLAAGLRARHFDRRTQALSLADCFLLAHALAEDASIATADPSVADVARREGVGLVALPDSSGRRP
jgi:PIN domain nuclease of toxin-antitoxin system